MQKLNFVVITEDLKHCFNLKAFTKAKIVQSVVTTGILQTSVTFDDQLIAIKAIITHIQNGHIMHSKIKYTYSLQLKIASDHFIHETAIPLLRKLNQNSLNKH